MFTGIVEWSCPVRQVEDAPGRRRLVVDLGSLRAATGERAGAELCAPGDSIAVNGVCLTVAGRDADVAAFDVITETLERTNLGRLAAGHRVHVERALRFGDRVDGHLVQGHVETTGTVLAVQEQPGQTWLEVGCPVDVLRRTLLKGSIALDGVSLTVADLSSDRLAVALVPHTLERTTLGARRPGDRLNVEPDLVGQWVARLIEPLRGGIAPG